MKWLLVLESKHLHMEKKLVLSSGRAALLNSDIKIGQTQILRSQNRQIQFSVVSITKSEIVEVLSSLLAES